MTTRRLAVIMAADIVGFAVMRDSPFRSRSPCSNDSDAEQPVK
jgi:hypothetical protein